MVTNNPNQIASYDWALQPKARVIPPGAARDCNVKGNPAQFSLSAIPKKVENLRANEAERSKPPYRKEQSDSQRRDRLGDAGKGLRGIECPRAKNRIRIHGGRFLVNSRSTRFRQMGKRSVFPSGPNRGLHAQSQSRTNHPSEQKKENREKHSGNALARIPASSPILSEHNSGEK